MELTKEQVRVLLTSDIIVRADNMIAKNNNATICRNYFDKSIEFNKKDIENSELDIDTLLNYVVNNMDIIICFSHYILKRDKKDEILLDCGISLAYAIYLIYLKEKSDRQLKMLIQRLRIPDSGIFFKQLKGIKDEMNL